MGWTESHPFTIASVDSPLERDESSLACDHRQMKFIIRSRRGFTRHLYEYSARQGGKDGSCRVSSYIDGPYGHPPDLAPYHTTILIAGMPRALYHL